MCIAMQCTALHYTALHCTALHCTALHCKTLVTAVLFASEAIICLKGTGGTDRGWGGQNYTLQWLGVNKGMSERRSEDTIILSGKTCKNTQGFVANHNLTQIFLDYYKRLLIHM